MARLPGGKVTGNKLLSLLLSFVAVIGQMQPNMNKLVVVKAVYDRKPLSSTLL